MAWSPLRRSNAGISRVANPETTPPQIPTTSATAPIGDVAAGQGCAAAKRGEEARSRFWEIKPARVQLALNARCPLWGQERSLSPTIRNDRIGRDLAESGMTAFETEIVESSRSLRGGSADLFRPSRSLRSGRNVPKVDLPNRPRSTALPCQRINAGLNGTLE